MKIGIACDHHGVKKKNQLVKYLKRLGHEVTDYGTNNKTRVDFVDYAIKTSETVSRGENELGILFCGTGIGMSITANKVKGIRAAKVCSIKDARYAKAHNNANVLAFASSEFNFKLKDMVDMFLKTKVLPDPTYAARNEKIKAYENAV